MTQQIDKETRSWPEDGEADEALSSLRDGLARIRSRLAVARRALQPDRDDAATSTDPPDRA